MVENHRSGWGDTKFSRAREFHLGPEHFESEESAKLLRMRCRVGAARDEERKPALDEKSGRLGCELDLDEGRRLAETNGRIF